MNDKDFCTVIENLKHDKLYELNLSNQQLSFEQIEVLANSLKINNSLKSLNISSNNLQDQGIALIAEALENNNSLLKLDLNTNKIRDKGAAPLGQALQFNTTLTDIDLEYNQITAHGGCEISKALNHNTTLTALNLGHNMVGPRYRKEIIDKLEKNKTIFKFTEDSLNKARKALAISTLNISNNASKETESDLKHETTTKKLKLENHQGTLDNLSSKHIFHLFKYKSNVELIYKGYNSACSSLLRLLNRENSLDKKLEIKQNYENFYSKLEKYAVKKYFLIKGVCKEIEAHDSEKYCPFKALTDDLLYEILKHNIYDLKEDLFGPKKAIIELEQKRLSKALTLALTEEISKLKKANSQALNIDNNIYNLQEQEPINTVNASSTDDNQTKDLYLIGIDDSNS